MQKSSQRKITNITTTPAFSKNKVLDRDTKQIVQYVSNVIDPATAGKRFLRCWWCTLGTGPNPIGCPLATSLDSGTKTYSTTGIFCSFNCAKAYAQDREKIDYSFKNSCSLLAQMLCEEKGRFLPVTITPSPDKNLLLEYGGHMTEDQYRSCFDKLAYTKKGVVKMFPVTVAYEENSFR
jgi:hypothetical protein